MEEIQLKETRISMDGTITQKDITPKIDGITSEAGARVFSQRPAAIVNGEKQQILVDDDINNVSDIRFTDRTL